MSTQRVSSVKIPVFDKDNYGLWKEKMMLFLQVANPKYLGVLRNGPTNFTVIVAVSIENNVVAIAARTYPKDPADYTPGEKEDASLDINLQLILVESLNPIMYNHVVNCKDATHIWETIETINEGTEEVRENRLEILTYEYENFKSTSGEGVTPPTRGQEFGPSLVTLACILLPFPQYLLQYNLTTPYISSHTS